MTADAPAESGDVLRAWRFALDLTATQLTAARQHAGAARWAYNHALGVKFAALDRRTAVIAELVAGGLDLAQAKKTAPGIPSKPQIQKAHNEIKGDDRTGQDGISPWWHTVSTYAFQSAFIDADTAFRNWWDSRTGKRAGRPVGRPRFKKKGRSQDSFRIHHDVTKPTIRPAADGYRRLIVPRLGSLRLHDSTKRLKRAIERGAVVQSVTISRHGHRWYASVLTKAPAPAVPVRPTRRQRAAGTVGVDLGVSTLAALSTGELITNPGHLAAGKRRLTKAQRDLSRTQKGSNRRRRAAAKVGKLHHLIAERRAGELHALTKRLATQFETVAIEDLNVAGMTRRPKPKPDTERPGQFAPNGAAAKSGLNRGILDAAPAELRRQLGYKTRWYGSELVVIDRWFPSSQTCSQCGARAKLTLRQRVFHCPACGFGPIDRDLNAAVNIAAQAAVAPGTVGDAKRPTEPTRTPTPAVGPDPRPATTRADHPPPRRVATPTRRRVGRPHAQTDAAERRPREALQLS